MTRERPAAERSEGVAGATIKQVRIDKWLFHARLCRTRSSAQAAAGAGKVRLNGARIDKPGRTLRCGDVVTLGKGAEILVVRVLAVAERRGSAVEARALYEILP